MSRNSYGFIAFKLPGGDMTDDELRDSHSEVIRGMVAVLKAAGGELTTLTDVATQRASDRERVGESSIADIVERSEDESN